MKVIQTEQASVHHPVPLSERAGHARQEQAAEHELLAENGIEHRVDHEEQQHAPVADELRPAFRRIQHTPEVKQGWLSEEWKDRHPQPVDDLVDLQFVEPGQKNDRQQPPPQATTEFSCSWIAWRIEPETMADGGPAEVARFLVEQEHD